MAGFGAAAFDAQPDPALTNEQSLRSSGSVISRPIGTFSAFASESRAPSEGEILPFSILDSIAVEIPASAQSQSPSIQVFYVIDGLWSQPSICWPQLTARLGPSNQSEDSYLRSRRDKRSTT
jgi:hypothetical protein